MASFLFQYYNVKISHNIKCCFKWFNSSLIKYVKKIKYVIDYIPIILLLDI